MQLEVDPVRVREMAAQVSQAQAEAANASASPRLIRGSVAAMSAGDGALAAAGWAFLDAWAEALADAARELDRLSSGLVAAAQLYAALEPACTLRTDRSLVLLR